jgi:hypothetical protein
MRGSRNRREDTLLACGLLTSDYRYHHQALILATRLAKVPTRSTCLQDVLCSLIHRRTLQILNDVVFGTFTQLLFRNPFQFRIRNP